MKKFLALILIVTSASLAKAQEFDLGIKAGANFATISDIDELDNKTGLRAGIFLGLKYDNIGIQPEIIYSEQGGKNDLGDYELNYVNVPVMLKYYIIGDIINLQVGPQFGFAVDNKFPSEADVENNDFDFSAAAGIGVELPLGFRVEARYNLGLTEIRDDFEAKNRVISVSLGYSFL